MASASEADRRHMRAALALARRGLGQVWPNPAVGCVIARGWRVVGRGWTQPGGRPHAETEALGRAGEAALGATAYVTLEPCAHEGITGPCAEALVGAGIGRAVVALEDPDPRVAGRGVARLREAGVVVAVGLEAEDAAALNAGYLKRVRAGRPLVTLKLATSLDGRIATRLGEARWITGKRARARAHLMRAEHDAVMVGIGTAMADDPALTCRLPGLKSRSPVRVVMDSRLRLPADAELVRSARKVPTWIVTGRGADAARRARLEAAGCAVIEVALGADDEPGLDAALEALAQRGITRLLVEGGAHLAGALLAARLVDALAWFRAPVILGGDGIPAVVAFGVEAIAEGPRFPPLGVEVLGDDLLETYGLRAYL